MCDTTFYSYYKPQYSTHAVVKSVDIYLNHLSLSCPIIKTLWTINNYDPLQSLQRHCLIFWTKAMTITISFIWYTILWTKFINQYTIISLKLPTHFKGLLIFLFYKYLFDKWFTVFGRWTSMTCVLCKALAVNTCVLHLSVYPLCECNQNEMLFIIIQWVKPLLTDVYSYM